MAPRGTQLPIGPRVAAIGAVLLIVSLFLDWYEELTAFTVFEFLDLLLVGLAAVSLASLAGAMGVVIVLFFAAAALSLLFDRRRAKRSAAILPPEATAQLQQEFRFYVWDEHTSEVRWMCAWDTAESDVDAFKAGA